MFSSNHLIILGASAVLIAMSTVLSVKFRLSSRKASVIFAVICVISEIVKDMLNIIPSEYGGYILDPEDIPIHLCSLSVFAMLFIVFSKNESMCGKLISAITIVGIIAPLFALAIPTEGTEFDRLITYQYFVFHSALMWYALHHICTAQVDLGKRAYVRNLGYAYLLLFLTLYINSALSGYGVNFIFERVPPVEGLPILNLDHGWHFYFLVLALITFLSITTVHAPFIVAEIAKKRRKG